MLRARQLISGVAVDSEIGDVQEHRARLGVGDDVGMTLGAVDEFGCDGHGLFERAGEADAVDQGVDFLAGNDLGFTQGEAFEQGPLGRSLGEACGVDHHRERDGTLTEIVASGLAELLGAFAQIEHIVDDLKCHAEVRAVLAQGLDIGLRSATEDGAHLSSARKESCGLSEDALVVVRARLVETVGVKHLVKLAIADVAEGTGEDGDDAGIHGGGCEHGRLGEEIVTEQDHGSCAELRVEGRFATAEGCPVDGVVVNERSGVEQFDARRSGDDGILVTAETASGEEEDERTKALAAGADQIEDETRDDRVVDPGDSLDAILDQLQVGAQHGKDILCGHVHLLPIHRASLRPNFAQLRPFMRHKDYGCAPGRASTRNRGEKVAVLHSKQAANGRRA